jgi:exodeoxyribonuclease V gamma subunit
VVCLLGLDDGVFPRTSGVDGDDVLARDPVVGERDRRSEDRQLLLDAILAAQEYLVVLYTGADERTNIKRPPAVPLGEVLDVIDATVHTSNGCRAREQVVVQHPLQPFDDRNFTAGALRADGPFSFDRSALAGARAAAEQRVGAPPFLAAPLPAQEPQPVELDALIRFLEHPLRGFLRQRLGVLLPDEGDELDDALHAELDGLSTWSVGDRWLRARLAGADPKTCQEAEWRRGALPPGALGERLLADVAEKAEKLVEAAAADQQDAARTLDVTVVLPHQREVRGTVGSVHGHTLSRVEYGGLKPKHRLRAWTQLLMLAASYPDEPWRATTLGRSKVLMRSTLTGPAADQARATLARLVDLYDRGRCEPLPLPLAAAAEYVDRRRSGADQPTALDKARGAWQEAFEHEDADAAVVFGAGAPFEVYLRQEPLPGDREDAFGEPEGTRFAALATRLWLPLLDAENLARP